MWVHQMWGSIKVLLLNYIGEESATNSVIDIYSYIYIYLITFSLCIYSALAEFVYRFIVTCVCHRNCGRGPCQGPNIVL